MNSYNYQSLCSVIKQMQRWQCVAICAVCSEKVAPIIRSIGLQQTWNLVKECLDFVWAAIEHEPNIEEAKCFGKALDLAPEWGCDDCYYLPHIVSWALDLLTQAINSIISHSPFEPASLSLDLILEIADRFDTELEEGKNNFPKIVFPNLEKTEESSQEHLFMILTGNQPSNQLIRQLKEEANTVKKVIEERLPIYCYYYLRKVKELEKKFPSS